MQLNTGSVTFSIAQCVNRTPIGCAGPKTAGSISGALVRLGGRKVTGVDVSQVCPFAYSVRKSLCCVEFVMDTSTDGDSK